MIEYSDKYSETLESLWLYYRNERPLNNNGVINNFPGKSGSCKFKQKITGETGADSIKVVEIMVPFK